MNVIKVENLTKIYNVADAQEGTIGFRELLSQQLSSLFSNKEKSNLFYALNDISFEVKKGEILGIIGKNGSGKSTLLKILSRITIPTSGKVTINGRVASLLEVGTGFHEELTGRENIFMSGIILGMKRWEIYKHFDEIVSFAGVEKFIDTPVKKYSSGMRLRLAFSVAAHLQPEILLIDEVLAVGDYEFEKKCMGIMSDIQKSGRTILFVSHNMEFIKRLCKKVIFLEKGIIKKIGIADNVISHYFNYKESNKKFVSWDYSFSKSNEIVHINSIEIMGQDFDDVFYREYPFIVRVKYEIFIKNALISLVFLFYNEKGDLLFTAFEELAPEINSTKREPGVYITDCIIPPFIFNNEKITISLHVRNTGQDGRIIRDNRVLQLEGIISFYVASKELRNERFISNENIGMINPNISWNIQKIKEM